MAAAPSAAILFARGLIGPRRWRTSRRTDVSDSSPISRIIDRPTGDTESKESSALIVGTAAFIVGGLIALIVFWGQEVPISGRGSLGDFAAIGGAITAAAAFVLGCVLRRR